MAHLLEPGSFFGKSTERRVAGAVTLTEGLYAPHARIYAHAHRAPYFCVVLGGAFEELTMGRWESCGPGTVVFHPTHEEHADRMGAAGARCFNLELGLQLAARLEAESALPGSRVMLPAGRAAALAVRHRPGRSAVVDPALDALAIEDTLLAMLAELPGQNPTGHGAERPPRWLDRATERLREPDPPRVTELAAEAGVHPVYFARAFRAATRLTPSTFAVRARLERAAAAMLASNATISSIAHAAGFADHSHFCRQFRRTFGGTPSAYRAAFR
jgi:AraC family transcriptional regulator